MEISSTQLQHHSYTNGTHRKIKTSTIAPPTIEYRECLKNHAASLGGHAVDGCCEYTPSLSSSPSIPTSLTCSACGCHRNFHRQRPRPPEKSLENIEDVEAPAPHILLALSGDAPPRPVIAPSPSPGASAGNESQKRRARTKFTPEQKNRMHELAECLGWRMPKRDVEGKVEGACRRIGVERSVFKVWMHNNKQSLNGSLSEVGSLKTNEGLGNGGGSKVNYEGNLGSCSDDHAGNAH